jgi:hypothetical protein
MNLYIETENGQIKNHPAFEDNLIAAFGSVPEHWELFVRVPKPEVSRYEVVDPSESRYEKVDGVWMDVWTVRPMTELEKTNYQQSFKDTWATLPNYQNFVAWVFDEDTCWYKPPIPRPEPIEGVTVLWCGSDNNWKEAPARPVDDNQYKFDFFAWQWVQVVN